MQTIDLTPSWSALLPALLAVVKDGTEEGRTAAAHELRRMAQAADQLNVELKTMAEHGLNPSAATLELCGGQP